MRVKKIAKWQKITLFIIVCYPLGTVIGRLIAGKPITWDEMLPFITSSVLIGVIFGLIYKFIQKNKEDSERQKQENINNKKQ